MDCSIVIPVYYNEGTLIKTFNEVKNVLEENKYITNFEFVFVDDGSKDNSINELISLKSLFSHIHIIKLTRNFGQVAAIYAGYHQASGGIVITMSADLQDPPTIINQMINEHYQKKTDIVICSRQEREDSYIRKVTSNVFYNSMRRLSFPNMPKGGFDFVLLKHHVVEYLLERNEANTFWQGQILWSGYSVSFIPYTRLKREIGKSRWTFGKKITYLLDGIMGYSYFPIRMISIVGILVFLTGLIYSIVIAINYFLGASPFKGWAPLMITILLLSGFQMLMLGIIGEYVWRTLAQVRKRPPFIIEKKL